MINCKKIYDSTFTTVLRGSSKRKKKQIERAESRQGAIPTSTLKAMEELNINKQKG